VQYEVYYLVKWEGFDEADNTWESKDSLLADCDETVKAMVDSSFLPPPPAVARPPLDLRVQHAGHCGEARASAYDNTPSVSFGLFFHIITLFCLIPGLFSTQM
jgi:hypothetical protein